MFTQEKFLKTCHPNLIPTVASRSHPFTPRRAIDSSGRIGSYYDACCDRVLQNCNLSFIRQSADSDQPSECFLTKCTTGEPSNLLEWLTVNYELRLSIALHMVREMGVGALINYSRPINKYTRFIYYSYYNHTDYLPDDKFHLLSRSKPIKPDTLATHVIVLVNWGIDTVAVVQLPPNDEVIAAIDNAIEKICISLVNGHTDTILLKNKKHLLEKIVHTEVFSNIPDLCKINSIIDFYCDILRIKHDAKLLKPYNYNLYPIQYFYAVNNGTLGIFKHIQREHVIKIELYLLQLSSCFKRLRTVMDDQNYLNLQRHLKDYPSDMRTRWSYLEKMYMREIQRVRDLVLGIRRGQVNQNRIHQILTSDKKEELMKSIDDFCYDLNVLQNEKHVIGNSIQKDFEYRSVIDREVRPTHDEQTIENRLLTGQNYEYIIYSNDDLYKNHQSQWSALDRQLLDEREGKSRLQFTDIDYSYSSDDLNRFTIVPTIKKKNNVSAPKPVAASTSLEQLNSDGIMNILLLGESGAGKSTFINAFVNYLLFDTLQQAQKKPIVLIPVSFLMTFGDNFQEHTVTFGEMDPLDNEDHDHLGQAVTQHCKSYVFTLKDGDNKERKLRIIDTPGIRDVRGLVQDDVNMQHILSYINNLTHLNAICILMKSNNTQFNIVFQSCLIQLFDFLGEAARDKIIFCFTHSRATFYTPENTTPLLKQLLESLPVKNIPFTKNNTFCFDSEPFRYLMAVQNGIKFSYSEEKEYSDSWDKSLTESKRFVKYIRTKMTASLLLGENESVKGAQLKISVLVRPMLESMRNILRNIVLCNAESHIISIELYPRSIKDSIAICLTCPQQVLDFDGFWITADALHVFHNECRTCPCSPNNHYPIDYELEYRLCNYPTSSSHSEMTKMVDDLCEASAEFAHFLFETADTSENDLFLIGIERMIKEEDDICVNMESYQLNSDLLNHLKQLKKNYEEMRRKLSIEKQHIQLSNVYDKIQQVSSYPMIELQMSAINARHKFMMKYYEYEVST